jgi:O-antigen/teichoic acid export membrane protein
VLLVVATLATSAVGFLSTLLIARVLGPGALGALGFGFGFVGVLSAVVLPGFSQAHTKRVAEGRDLGRCIGTMGAIQIVLQALMVGLFLAARSWWPGLIPGGVAPVLLVGLLASQILANLASVVTGAFVGREWAVAYAAIMVTGRLVRFAAMVAVLICIPDVKWVALVYPIEAVVELMLGLWVVCVRKGVRLRPPTRESFLDYWAYARPLLLTTPVGMLQDSLDRVLVARWAGLPAAGYYQVARALWELLGTINASPFQLLFARLSQLFAVRSPAGDAEARRVFVSAVDKLLFLAVPVSFLLWALRTPVITWLYGTGFLPARDALMIFVVAALAQAALNPYQFVIYALEQHSRFVPVVLLRLGVYLVTLVVAVLLWGGTGAAAVRLLLVLFPAWIFVRWTRELVGVGFQPCTWVYATGFGLLVAVSEGVHAGLGRAGLPEPVTLGAGITSALAVYAAWLWWAHPGLIENLGYARDLLHIRRFAAFLRSGLSRGG